MVPIGTQLFLLANGLSIVKAPYPRERFLGFAVLGGCIGLIVGTPAAMLLAVAAVAADAKHTHEQNEAARRAAAWRAPPAPSPDDRYGSYDGYGDMSHNDRVW
jgi:hypothetical protein